MPRPWCRWGGRTEAARPAGGSTDCPELSWRRKTARPWRAHCTHLSAPSPNVSLRVPTLWLGPEKPVRDSGSWGAAGKQTRNSTNPPPGQGTL